MQEPGLNPWCVCVNVASSLWPSMDDLRQVQVLDSDRNLLLESPWTSLPDGLEEPWEADSDSELESGSRLQEGSLVPWAALEGGDRDLCLRAHRARFEKARCALRPFTWASRKSYRKICR